VDRWPSRPGPCGLFAEVALNLSREEKLFRRDVKDCRKQETRGATQEGEGKRKGGRREREGKEEEGLGVVLRGDKVTQESASNFLGVGLLLFPASSHFLQLSADKFTQPPERPHAGRLGIGHLDEFVITELGGRRKRGLTVLIWS